MILLLLSLLLALPVSATPPPADRAEAPGLLVMAHGGGPEWDEAVRAAVAPLAERYPTAIAFGMADPETLREALDELAAKGVRRVAVVRLFLDGGSFLHQTEYFLGLREDPPARFLLHTGGHGASAGHGTGHAMPHGAGHSNGHTMQHGANAGHGNDHAMHHGASQNTPPPIAHDLTIALSKDGLMQAKEVAAILAARAEALSTQPEQESVLVLAHGTGDDRENARWIAAMEHLSGDLRGLGFHSVRTETLREDWPDRRADAERNIRSFVEAETEEGRTVIVVPFRLFGFGPYERVLEGLTYRRADAGLLPHAAITDWIAAQYQTIASREGWLAVSN